jgi:hypothetical protein
MRQIKLFLVFSIIIFAGLFLLTGCAKNQAPQQLTVKGEHAAADNISVPTTFITYSNPTYGFQLSYPPEMNYETNRSEGMLVLTFPETLTTSTNLSRAEVWISANQQECDAFGGSEDPVVAWHYSKMLSTGSAFPQTLTAGGVEFKRLKCSGGAMSHVADTLSYIGDVSGKQIAITLFLYSSNPDVYSDELRPRKYDPAPIEKMYLQILNSFKIMKTYE